jgi:hypothetical protein
MKQQKKPRSTLMPPLTKSRTAAAVRIGRGYRGGVGRLLGRGLSGYSSPAIVAIR